MTLCRRRFLSAGLGVAAAGAAGAWLGACDGEGEGESRPGPTTTAAGDTGSSTSSPTALPSTTPGTLVLVTLYGGNDALDTLIPIDDPVHRELRGQFAPAPDALLPLADGYGLHPSFAALHGWWGRGQLAVVGGVGQPGGDRSHFHCMDVWQAGIVDHAPTTGWLGRWLDVAGGDDPRRAVAVGPSVPLALVGERRQGAAIPSATLALPGDDAFSTGFAAISGPGHDGLAGSVAATGSDLLELLEATADLEVAGQARTRTGTRTGSRQGRGAAGLADQLDLVAACRAAGFPTSVYAVSQGGYDTHATEEGTHEALLAELDGALGGFFERLAVDGTDRGVTVVVYSEFGRRVAPNASGGTDHGKAGVAFAVGPAVRGGLYGEPSPLDDLDDGDLRVTTDFRDMYATVLEGVLGVDPSVSLDGARTNLGFV